MLRLISDLSSTDEQVVVLEKGDSWVVPKGANHKYEILEPFTAVEATHLPAYVEGRDKQL